MCYEAPGPRCVGRARKNYIKARTALRTAALAVDAAVDGYIHGTSTDADIAAAKDAQHRARFAFNNAQREKDESPHTGRALARLADIIDTDLTGNPTHDAPLLAKTAALRARRTDGRTRYDRKIAAYNLTQDGNPRAASIVLNHGTEYAWAAGAPFDLRESVFTPNAVTRSGFTYTDNNGDTLSTERIETFARAEQVSDIVRGGDHHVTTYRIPAYTDTDGSSLAVQVTSNHLAGNIVTGTLTANGDFTADTAILDTLIGNNQEPLSAHTTGHIDDWSHSVHMGPGMTVNGFAITGTTEPVPIDPADLADYDLAIHD
jgi:hypothetical protein